MLLPLTINLLLAINIIVSLLIIFVVLMQRPKSEGLGAAFGGGMTENLFGAQTSNVLANFTRWLGAIFFGLTLLLSILYAKQSTKPSSIQAKLLQSAAASGMLPLATPAATSGTASPALSHPAAVSGTNVLSGTAPLASGTEEPFGDAHVGLGAPSSSPSALLPNTSLSTSTPAPVKPVAPVASPAASGSSVGH